MKMINNNSNIGFWIELEECEERYGRLVKCSYCNYLAIENTNFCPACGKRMFRLPEMEKGCI